MEDGASISGGSAYADSPAKQNGFSVNNKSKERHTSVGEKSEAQQDLPESDNSWPGSSAPPVNGLLGPYGGLLEDVWLPETGAATENGTAAEYDALIKKESTKEEDTTHGGRDVHLVTGMVNGTTTPRESKKWQVKDVIQNIMRANKVTKALYTKDLANICKKCQALDLNIEKFIIQDHSSDRSQQAYKSYLRQKSVVEKLKFPLGSGSWKFPLGPLAEIQGRSATCPFCFLVVKSLQNSHDEQSALTAEELQATCYVSWQVDGREIVRNTNGRVVSSRPRTRRIQLHWEQGAFPDSYLVLVAPEVAQRSYRAGPHFGESDALFLGRSITGAADNQALIKSWLDLCQASHGDMCKITHGPEFEDMILRSYFGVVDVHEMRLTSLPRDQKYVALSYMWGIGTRYTTELGNIQKHQAYGGLEKVFHRLPLVIQETIKLVRVLGERYLWVDSLCIVQNSDRSWKLNAGVMDIVYGNAHLTICAADGEGANTGLQGITPADRSTFQYTEECAPNVRLMVSHLAETYIKKSKWNTRGWTFQERLLSKRCLIFTEGRVYFQCRSTAMSEDIIAEQKDAGWSIELVQAPLQMLNDLTTRAFWVYANCVSLYTARILGREKDILAAFNGMSNLIGEKMRAPLIFGLPSSFFDLALLWEAEDAYEPRRPRSRKEAQDWAGLKFPSWSWCGWRGTAMTYRTSTIGACLPNVHQWLTEHTWIHWYIRDGHGNLRPIWDDSTAGDDGDMTGDRWKGYKTAQGTDGSPFDSYGRILGEEIFNNKRSQFFRTLPEFPYRVSVSTTPSAPSRDFPDQSFLQFWTWSAFLRLVPHEQSSDRTLGKGLCRYNIADYTGDWCGTIVLNANWQPGGKEVEPGSEHEFIAISEAKDFSQEENDVWTYYIPKERDQSEWDLYYVLLVEHEPKGGIMRRVGLGKVFKEAFQNPCLPGREWKEIILE